MSMARAPSGTTFVPLVRSLLNIDSSNGPKLTTFRFSPLIGCFSSTPALGVGARYCISRSRRQLAGLWPKACLKSLHRCA
jgi:hypothetical protein